MAGRQERTALYREPKQARGKATCAAIFEAATRIVEEEGEGRLTTNLIAERAGVSIGTLYQYFPNKRAILAAIAQSETDAARRNAARAVSEGMSEDRAAIRYVIAAFAGRPNTRRAAVRALMEMESPVVLDRRMDQDLDGRSEVEAFVVTRAVMGAVRSAVFEDSPHLHTQAFEDALVRLSRALRS